MCVGILRLMAGGQIPLKMIATIDIETRVPKLYQNCIVRSVPMHLNVKLPTLQSLRSINTVKYANPQRPSLKGVEATLSLRDA